MVNSCVIKQGQNKKSDNDNFAITVADSLQCRRGFTLIELLVVIAIIAIIAAMLLPVLEKAKERAQEIQCANNLRQIMIAWKMYGDDNKEFAPNEDYEDAPRWCAGNMSGGTVNPLKGAPTYTGIDATNTGLLVEPHYSCVGPYISNPLVFKCPADLSTWSTANSPGHAEQPRVRSYSMNQAVGPSENGSLVGSGDVMGHWLSSKNAQAPGGFPWKVFTKDTDIVGMSPSDLFVLLDEHPESINDAAFAVDMPTAPNFAQWIDVPSKAHVNSDALSFADCHAEIHKWLEPGNIQNISWQPDSTASIGNTVTSKPNDPDVIWLAHHTTCAAPNSGLTYIP